ncbi:hypothetical protein L227DRAFT_441183 [Lentinus tigrinus ALCF2SS1-6]|uniref:Uncharacterized protein n=1 Tax=Lentinus tigrinus ALCF2SS1-6 TaxID=1328759 RepID=A0A5C2RP30_9APHY|nr:hypothetical protein L227DRAFT_441183 [Lentinus tigrinus ALCF2SS1-6]
MTKVKVHTTPAGTISVPMDAALSEMNNFEAETRYLFACSFRCCRAGYIPRSSKSNALKQHPSSLPIPYAMAKFFFEYIVGLFYKHVFAAPKETYVWQDNGARRHLRVWLPRRRRLALADQWARASVRMIGYAHELTVVDQRLVQDGDGHGHGHDWWQVSADGVVRCRVGESGGAQVAVDMISCSVLR